jgi:hypothetical protein
MVDAQNKAGGDRHQQYQNIVGMTPRGVAQSYDIVAARCRPRAVLFHASTVKL